MWMPLSILETHLQEWIGLSLLLCIDQRVRCSVTENLQQSVAILLENDLLRLD
jgi:hypothetical protein